MRQVAVTLGLLAWAACGRGPTPDSKQIYEEAFADLLGDRLREARRRVEPHVAVERPDRDPSDARLRLLYAEILLAQGDVERAYEVTQQPLPEEEPWRQLELRRHVAAGDALLRLGRRGEAGPHLERARLLSRADDEAHVRFRYLLFTARFHARGEEWDLAETVYRQVIDESRQWNLPTYEVGGLAGLAVLMFARARFDEAVPVCEQTLSAARRAGAVRGEAVARGNLSIALANLGQFELAAGHRAEANGIFERIGDKENLERGHGSLGQLQWLSGDVDAAIDSFTRAYVLAEEIGARGDAALWAGNLAAAYVEKSAWDEAAKWNRLADAWKQKAGQEQSRAYNRQNDALVAAGRGRHEEAIALFQGLLDDPAVPTPLRWSSHAAIAESLAAVGKKALADRHFREALKLIEQTRSGLERPDFKIGFLSNLIRFYRAYVRFLLAHGEQERALEVADTSRSRLLTEITQSATLPGAGTASAFREIAARTGAVLLSYWLDPKESRVWVAGPRGISSIALAPADQITALVETYRRILASSARDPLLAGKAAGERLYRTLIEPVGEHLPRGARVIVVPDGPLHYLNFEALPVPGGEPRYWIEDVTLAVAPALGILTSARAASRRPERVLVIGDAIEADPRYPRLKFAGEEIAGIARRWPAGECRVVSGAAATPSIWAQENAVSWPLIHFAAHAEANSRSPLDSAIILSPDRGRYKLYARDFASQPLRADLVTISACSSAGVKSYAGEGLVGLAWVFLRGGANSVIAGLWDVNDRSTAVLMGHLYAGLAEGQTPLEALRGAKLSLLREGGLYSRPYHWAPFQLYTRVVRFGDRGAPGESARAAPTTRP